jgi:hypothetical protein
MSKQLKLILTAGGFWIWLGLVFNPNPSGLMKEADNLK